MILAAVAIVIAAVVWARADRIRDWQIHAVLATGTVIVSLANYYAGPSTLYPLLYTWTALYAFYFFPLARRSRTWRSWPSRYAVVLAIQDADSAVVRWLLAVGTPLLAGLLISRLLAPASATARELRARSEAARRGSCSTPRRTRSSRSTATA